MMSDLATLATKTQREQRVLLGLSILIAVIMAALWHTQRSLINFNATNPRAFAAVATPPARPGAGVGGGAAQTGTVGQVPAARGAVPPNAMVPGAVPIAGLPPGIATTAALPAGPAPIQLASVGGASPAGAARSAFAPGGGGVAGGAPTVAAGGGGGGGTGTTPTQPTDPNGPGTGTNPGGPTDPTNPGGGQNPVAAVPEPSVWALSIIGFAMIGASMRRRGREMARRRLADDQAVAALGH